MGNTLDFVIGTKTVLLASMLLDILV